MLPLRRMANACGECVGGKGPILGRGRRLERTVRQQKARRPVADGVVHKPERAALPDRLDERGGRHRGTSSGRQVPARSVGAEQAAGRKLIQQPVPNLGVERGRRRISRCDGAQQDAQERVEHGFTGGLDEGVEVVKEKAAEPEAAREERRQFPPPALKSTGRRQGQVRTVTHTRLPSRSRNPGGSASVPWMTLITRAARARSRSAAVSSR